MSEPTPHERVKFTKTFQHGCEFWTSEDGTLLSLVIIMRDNWAEVLKHNHPAVWQHERFDRRRGKNKFVYQEWVGREFYDGPGTCKQRRGKVWRVTDERTPFPVIVYDLKVPR